MTTSITTQGNLTQSPVPTTKGKGRGRRGNANAQLLIGAVLVAIVVLLALVSFVWTPGDAYGTAAQDRLLHPNAEHLFGTDRFGRDVLSQIMIGARTTLLVGIVSVAIAVLLGVPFGIMAGMKPGATDTVVMGAGDIILAFPGLLLAIIFGASFGASTWTAIIALGIGAAPAFARVARSGAMQVMRQDYIQAARGANRSEFSIAVKHVLPNISGMLVVQASVNFAIAVLAEAGLSFLGLGTMPPTPSWGRMLQESQQFLGTHEYLAIYPGIAIAIVVLGFNLLGDGLRDHFDPKTKGRS
ncbi:MAG: ABC transporter permease [Galactobacter sp.]